MKRTSLEPGLLQVFRLFVGGRLVLLSLSMCSQLVQPEPRILRCPLLGIVESAFLIGYLSWPWLRDRLGKAYSDDGRGFDTTSPPSDGQYGLRGMRERAEMIEGALEIESQPGHGTIVRLTVEAVK